MEFKEQIKNLNEKELETLTDINGKTILIKIKNKKVNTALIETTEISMEKIYDSNIINKLFKLGFFMEVEFNPLLKFDRDGYPEFDGFAKYELVPAVKDALKLLYNQGYSPKILKEIRPYIFYKFRLTIENNIVTNVSIITKERELGAFSKVPIFSQAFQQGMLENLEKDKYEFKKEYINASIKINPTTRRDLTTNQNDFILNYLKFEKNYGKIFIAEQKKDNKTIRYIASNDNGAIICPINTTLFNNLVKKNIIKYIDNTKAKNAGMKLYILDFANI